MGLTVTELECDHCLGSELGLPEDYTHCYDCNGQFCVEGCIDNHECRSVEEQQVYEDLARYDED